MSRNVPRRGSRLSGLKGNFSGSTKNFFRSKHRMLSQAQRTTILELHRQGVGKREIARVLGISRVSVRKVLRANSSAVPELQRPEKAESYRQQILELLEKCKGNLVRVHEELIAGGAELSYPALTAFCRRHGIGQTARARTGWKEAQGADRLGGAVLFADAVFSVLSEFSALRLQGVSDRCAALPWRRPGAGHDRQHACGRAARQRAGHGAGAGNGGLWRASRLSVRGARDRQCESFGTGGETLISTVIIYAQSAGKPMRIGVILN